MQSSQHGTNAVRHPTGALVVAPPKAQSGRLIRFIDRFMPDAMQHVSEDKRRQVRTAIGFLMASWFVALVFAIANLRQGFFGLAYIELTCVVLLSIIIPMMRRTERFELLGNLGMSLGVATIFMACWVGNGLEAPAVVLIPLIPAWAYLGYGRRSASLWSWASVVGVGLLFVAKHMEWMPAPPSGESMLRKRFLETALGVGMGFLAARVFSDIKDYALTMLQKRTDELKEAHARIGELFDNMRQGVLAFDDKGCVEGPTSAQANKIFATDDLTGKRISDLLFADDPVLLAERDNFEMWLQAAFSAPMSDWEELSELTPRRIVQRSGKADEQHLVLEFRPVATDDGGLRRVMLLVMDESERVRMERAAKARDDAHRKEVQELRKLVAGGAHLLIRFLETARARFAEISDVMRVDGNTAPHESEVAVAFQHVHTVRGEARTFQLTSLETLCSQMEDRLAPLRQVGTAHIAGEDKFRGEMRGDIQRARELLDEAEKHLVAVSPIGEAVLDQITVRKTLLEEACTLAVKDTPKGSSLARAMERLAARPFGESTQQLADAVPLWAKRESKRVVLDLVGRDALVPHRVSRVLGGALTHLVRNAIAHGVERPNERERGGKSAEARVRLTCSNVGDAAIITVEDDGRGIDEAAVRSEAERLGLPSDRSLEELLFEPGLSTCSDVTEIAGRGMGMSAVRRDLATVGYQVRITTALGHGTRVEIAPTNMPGASTSGRPRRSEVA